MMKNIFFFLLVFSPSLFAKNLPLDQVKELVRAQGKGIVIMDLDETVLDSQTRKYSALLEAHNKHCGMPDLTVTTPKSVDCEKLLGLSKIDFYRLENGYSMYELMKRLNIPYTPFVGEFSKTMVELYLGGQWMDQDSPMPGANTYVRELKRLGAEVYFVSARYEHLQREGSLEQLLRLGFMQKGEEDYLILRKKDEEPLAFKTNTVNKIKARAQEKNIPVVGLFENESENLNAWKKAFPRAIAIYIKGNTLLKVPLDADIFVIEDYR